MSDSDSSFDLLSDSDHSDASDVEQQEPEEVENVVETSGEDEVSEDDDESSGEDDETSESEEEESSEDDTSEDEEDWSDDEEETPQNADVKTLLQASEEATVKLLDEKYLANMESLRALESVERNTDQEAKKKIEEAYGLGLQEYAERRAQRSLAAEPPVSQQAVNYRSASQQQASSDAVCTIDYILQHIQRIKKHEAKEKRKKDARRAIIGALVVMALLCPFMVWYSMGKMYPVMAENDLRNFKCLEELPEHLLAKWTPDFSRYQGVEGFAHYIGNQKHVKHLYELHPVLKNMKENQVDFQFFTKSENESGKLVRLTGPCVYKDEDGRITVFLKDGFLHVNYEYQVRREMKNATFVYSVSE